MKAKNRNRPDLYQEFQDSLNYEFRDLSLLEEALIHRSYLNESADKNLVSNERLEFLGDAVLEVVVSDLLFERYPEKSEGWLTKRRSQIVCEPSFSYIASIFGIGKLILMGKGEEATGGRQKASILSDAFEAVIGAIYKDGGIEWIRSFFAESLDEILQQEVGSQRLFIDYKTQVQELLHSQAKDFEYQLLREEGPSHEKIFTVGLYVEGKKICEAQAGSKKMAEQKSAELAYELLTEQKRNKK